MKTVEEEQNVGAGMELASYVVALICQLKRDHKYPAAHGYLCALHSFQRFAGGRDVSLPVREVFTRERLKAYEDWLLAGQRRKLNTVSGYMRSLRAVYNRWLPPGTPGHDAGLFRGVYTKVVSQTKRALSGSQMERLLRTEGGALPEELTREQQAVLAYFLLMFMFRGMPFIDLAHLRKCDVHGRHIVYRRHKTGRQLTVEIPPAARRLMQEYGDRSPDGVYLFPILNPDLRGGWERYNAYQAALRRFNRLLRQAMRLLLPGVGVSSYTARHTWATIAYHLGQPIGIISQSLGHSSIRVTETYLKPFADARIDEANRQLLAAVKKGKWKGRPLHNML